MQLVLSFPGLLEPIAIEGIRAVDARDEAGAEGDAGAGIEFEPGPARDALAAIIDKVRSARSQDGLAPVPRARRRGQQARRRS